LTDYEPAALDHSATNAFGTGGNRTHVQF